MLSTFIHVQPSSPSFVPGLLGCGSGFWPPREKQSKVLAATFLQRLFFVKLVKSSAERKVRFGKTLPLLCRRSRAGACVRFHRTIPTIFSPPPTLRHVIIIIIPPPPFVRVFLLRLIHCCCFCYELALKTRRKILRFSRFCRILAVCVFSFMFALQRALWSPLVASLRTLRVDRMSFLRFSDISRITQNLVQRWTD